jgi:hypothetical protein
MVCSRKNLTLPRIFYHCVTKRKVIGSIPDNVVKIFYSFRPHCVPGVDSASERNEYQGCFVPGVDSASERNEYQGCFVPGVDSASERNEYQGCFGEERGLKAAVA